MFVVKCISVVLCLLALGSGIASSMSLLSRKQRSIPSPRFLEAPESIRVEAGQTAVLPCSVQNLGPKVVFWIKVDDYHPLAVGSFVYSSDDRFDVSHSYSRADETSQWDLRIRDVTEDDSGVYECQISSRRRLSNFIRLNVTETPAIRLTGEQYVELGDDITLQCEAGSQGVTWFKDHERVRSNDRVVVRETVSPSGGVNSQLSIDPSRTTDSGSYICRSGDSIETLRVQIINLGRHSTMGDSTSGERESGSSSTSTDSNSQSSSQSACNPQNARSCFETIQTMSDNSQVCRVMEETRNCVNAFLPNCNSSARQLVQNALRQLSPYDEMCEFQEERDRSREEVASQ